MQKIENFEFILKLMITTFFEWQELNKEYHVYQRFELRKADIRTMSETGKKFIVIARYLDLKEIPRKT
jgi:hypothetical protein